MRPTLTLLAFLAFAAPAAAEPATADPAFIFADGQREAEPHLVARLPLGTTALSLVATGRAAGVDTQMAREDFHEAIAFEKAMPGYPQPPHVTIDLRVSF